MRIVKRAEIDVALWDQVVGASRHWRNPLFGQSWYLDITADGEWYGLVWGDYEAVAPVATNRKLLWQQVYRPTITQQMGIYATKAPSEEVERDLCEHLCTYRRVVYALPQQVQHTSLRHRQRSNYMLDINASKTAIEHITSKSKRKHLRHAGRYLDLSFGGTPASHLSFVRHALRNKYSLSLHEQAIFEALADYLTKNGAGYIIQATNKKGALVSSSLVGQSADYATLLLAGVNDEGRKVGARSFLMHYTIEQAIKDKLHRVDFEGSDLPGVASFFRDFGGRNYPYQEYWKDDMPSIIQRLRPLKMS